MESTEKTVITVESTVDAPIGKVWDYWTAPRHITNWSHASDDWHTTRAENDLRVGGKFSSRMEAKDSSFGFDFGGVYDVVEKNQAISYTLADGRKVSIVYKEEGNSTYIVQQFEAETEHSIELQQNGWQAILDNFKRYTEAN